MSLLAMKSLKSHVSTRFAARARFSISLRSCGVQHQPRKQIHNISLSKNGKMEAAGAKPFISIRKWEQLFDRPAEETTDTLVLTSALKYYTDVRILLSGSQKTLPPSSTPLDAARLEWGFAGRAYSTPADEKTGTAAHTKWVHWIDNKTKEEVEDAGWMYPVEGTNDVLEKGTMLNPETGKEGQYQEMWTDLDIEKAVLPREEGYVSWVLQLEGEGGKGLVVRIGQWVQGVVRRGEEVSVARWKGGNNGWEKVLEVGRLDLGAALGKENEDGQKTWVVGDVFKGKDGEWKCVESLTW